MKTAQIARAAVGALALSVLAACGSSTDFTVKADFTIGPGTTLLTDTATINLATMAGDAWDQRKHITDARITSAIATITQVYEDQTADPLTASGSATMARSETGPTVTVAEQITPLDITQVGNWLAAKDLDGASSMIKDALKGDGKLVFKTDAAQTPGDANVHIDVQVVLTVEAKWSLF